MKKYISSFFISLMLLIVPTSLVLVPVASAQSRYGSSHSSWGSGSSRNNGGGQTTTPPVITNPNPVVPVTPVVPVIPPVAVGSTPLQWGAYVGDTAGAMSALETLVGKQANIYADFEAFGASFPIQLSSTVGQQGKTLLVFWEPSTGLASIANGSQDASIKLFAAGAKAYGYPVILAPFDEMNLNETSWGAGVGGNTPAQFISAWQHIHDLFAGDTNVKFALDYNNVSIPASSSDTYASYYPGANYVDIVGIDGYNFGNPWQSFSQVFSAAMTEASQFNKPIYILATASAPGAQKATWISQGLGTVATTYPNVKGWVWFDVNKESNWTVNSDAASLAAFKSILPN